MAFATMVDATHAVNHRLHGILLTKTTVPPFDLRFREIFSPEMV